MQGQDAASSQPPSQDEIEYEFDQEEFEEAARMSLMDPRTWRAYAEDAAARRSTGRNPYRKLK